MKQLIAENTTSYSLSVHMSLCDISICDKDRTSYLCRERDASL